MNKRQEEMLNLHNSSDPMEFGSLEGTGIDLVDLIEPDRTAKLIEKEIQSGLTGVVYKLKKGRTYNLKRKRSESLVQNIDGKVSFLNELLVRKRILEYKKEFEVLDRGTAKTVYAHYRHGLLLSEWIDGDHPEKPDPEWIGQVLEIHLALQKIGLFEWDLCQGNLLLDHGQMKLFDFGYCYRFDPLKAFNSDGTRLPQFHALERLETRYLMLELYKLKVDQGKKVAMDLYRKVKQVGIDQYRTHLEWLKDHHASKEVVDFYENIIQKWQAGVADEKKLDALYVEESVRSHHLDIEDDLSGKTCTPNTLIRIQHLREIHGPSPQLDALYERAKKYQL